MPKRTELTAVADSRSPLGCTAEQPPVLPFRDWCKLHKVLWDSCDVRVSHETGRGVYAVRDIAAGDVVVEVPDDAVLMADNCVIAPQLTGVLLYCCLHSW